MKIFDVKKQQFNFKFLHFVTTQHSRNIKIQKTRKSMKIEKKKINKRLTLFNEAFDTETRTPGIHKTIRLPLQSFKRHGALLFRTARPAVCPTNSRGQDPSKYYRSPPMIPRVIVLGECKADNISQPKRVPEY